jgi:hypothetical protein
MSNLTPEEKLGLQEVLSNWPPNAMNFALIASDWLVRRQPGRIWSRMANCARRMKIQLGSSRCRRVAFLSKHMMWHFSARFSEELEPSGSARWRLLRKQRPNLSCP